MKSLLLFLSALVVLGLGLSSCISGPRPTEEYALAQSALNAARAVEASRHSPGYWSQADEAFRRAKLLYQERDFSAAREEFIRSRLAAEKAENSARLIRQKNGEVL